mgnify:CR=1 FL=1
MLIEIDDPRHLDLVRGMVQELSKRVRLVREGQRDRDEMRAAGIGDGDLNMALRGHGHTELGGVQDAFLERNGDITLIPKA